MIIVNDISNYCNSGIMRYKYLWVNLIRYFKNCKHIQYVIRIYRL